MYCYATLRVKFLPDGGTHVEAEDDKEKVSGFHIRDLRIRATVELEFSLPDMYEHVITEVATYDEYSDAYVALPKGPLFASVCQHFYAGVWFDYDCERELGPAT